MYLYVAYAIVCTYKNLLVHVLICKGVLFLRQGEESKTVYIILNGRVRSVVKNADGKKQLADEYGRGETVGVVS